MLRCAAFAAFLLLLAACGPRSLEDKRSECTKQAAGTEEGYVDFEVEIAIPHSKVSHDIENYAVQLSIPGCEWALHALMSAATVDSLFERADSLGLPSVNEHVRLATADVFAYKFVRTDGAHAIFVTGVSDLEPDMARIRKYEEDRAPLLSTSD